MNRLPRAKQTTRMISPSLWSNPELGTLPLGARLLYIALIGLADDYGRHGDDPRRLKAAVFPFDTDVSIVDVSTWLDGLAEAELIVTYNDEHGSYLAHPKWWKHQWIRRDRRVPSPYPDPPGYVEDEQEEHAAPKVKPKAKSKSKPKEPYSASTEAKRARAQWHRRFPLKDEYQDDHLKTLDDMHRIDKLPWSEINAICEFASEQWAPKGFIASPTALREKKPGSEVKQYEKIQAQMASGNGSAGDLAELESQI